MSIFSKVQTQKVIVNPKKGGYSPDVIHFKQGQPAELKFKPEGEIGCLNIVTSKDMNINQDITKQKVTTVKVPTDKKGEFHFACGMDMYHGKVVVD